MLINRFNDEPEDIDVCCRHGPRTPPYGTAARLHLHRATLGTSGGTTFVNIVVWGSPRALAMKEPPTNDDVGLSRIAASQRAPAATLRDFATGHTTRGRALRTWIW